MSASSLIAASIQMVSAPDVPTNLTQAARLVAYRRRQPGCPAGGAARVFCPDDPERHRQGGGARSLQVDSPHGDIKISPQVVTRDELLAEGGVFDVIVLSCKAYDLASAIDAIAPAVGEQSVILPLLNGVSHIDTLAARFGAARNSAVSRSSR